VPSKKSGGGKGKIGGSDGLRNSPHHRRRAIAARVGTYRAFLKYSAIFAARVLVILALFAYFLT
jgi:hypothetical protein